MTSIKGASSVSSVVSLVKTIIGAGLLSMPLAYSTDGIVFGTFIIGVAAITSGYGLYVQCYVSKFVLVGHATFFNLCSITYPSLSVIFDLAIAIQCFGCAVSYLVLIGDLMPTIVSHVGGIDSDDGLRKFWILASACVCIPLSLLKNLDSLKYTSIAALMAIGYMSLLVMTHYFVGDVPSDLKGNITLFPPNVSGIFKTFSIIIFAYTGHQNMFSIINESKDKSLTKLSNLVSVSIGIATILFVLVGLTGYLTFGDIVNGNVILLYTNSLSATIGRCCIVFTVLFSFPLMLHPARISVNNIYFWCKTKFMHLNQSIDSPEQEELLSNPDQESNVVDKHIIPFPDHVFYIITFSLLITGYIFALTIQSFALVLAIVGATGSTSISFILPGLFGYKLIGTEDPHHITKKQWTLKILSLVLVIWGFAVMILSLYTTIFST